MEIQSENDSLRGRWGEPDNLDQNPIPKSMGVFQICDRIWSITGRSASRVSLMC